MSQATVRFDLGAESVTVPLDIDLDSSVPLSGDVSGTFGDCFVAGDLNLTGNLFIEGVMTGIDTFHVQGNGFTIFFQNGGRPDLHGKFKAPWGPWGTSSTGWISGDRIAVAPTAPGVYAPSESVWSNWSAPRPVNSPDKPLLDGRVWKPSVVNLSQSIVIENLARGFHFHDSAGPPAMSDVKFLNCGTVGVLGNYPVHWHLLGENSRGSLLERVVVEGGKNHAFVPHGSHGVTLRDCVAYRTESADAFWWDPPLDENHVANNSNDTTYEHVLGLWVKTPVTNHRLAAFTLGAGSGNTVTDSVMACVQGGADAAGWSWPEQANQNVGGTVWGFSGNATHNNKSDGIFVWQNDPNPHVIEDFVAFNCGRSLIDHGAYSNNYTYRRMVLQGGIEAAFRLHATGTILIEDVVSDGPLVVMKHRQNSTAFERVVRCQFSSVRYSETSGDGVLPSWLRYEDCGLTPTDFDLAGIVPSSLIEITEGGVLTHRWAGGWS